MNSHARRIIRDRLGREKKQLTFNVRTSLIEKMDVVSDIFYRINGQNYPRNTLLEDAIISYIDEISEFLKEEYNLDLIDVDDEFDIEKHNKLEEKIKKENKNKEEKEFDTVIYPGYKTGFEQVFLGDNQWYYVRIKADKIDKIKYIGIYISSPVSAITHYGKVLNYIEAKDSPGKYVVLIDGNEIYKLDKPITLGNCNSSSTRAPRYTTLEKLKKASTIEDL